jgi:dolichol-phosphate mannosyltransferase
VSSDRIITIEGDNTSRDELVPIMLGRLEREAFDVVLASPYAYGGVIENTNGLRIFLSYFANEFVKAFLGIKGIHTTSSFFRVYTGETILKLQARFGPRILQRAGFESMIELLKKLILVEARISEIAMKLDTSRRVGSSKMKLLRTIRGYFSLYVDMKQWK